MARMKQTARKRSEGRRQRRALKNDISQTNDENISDTSSNISNEESAVDQLIDLLSSLKDTPGKFATNGVMQASPFPGLNIEGVGPISLPLCGEQAKQIINVAKQAPFGLGEKTVVDEHIRKSWEIQPSQITLENPRFHTCLKSLVLNIKSKLGCDINHVEATLYKLLLYEEGGHFKAHRDSEKEDGMFGTMIVQLPSIFKGNHLLIHHGGKTDRVEFDCEESHYEMIYAAHYTDCSHEITPLESGYRLALIYNLVWTAPSAPPSANQTESRTQALASLLPEVEEEHDNVFGWSLEHKYSESSLQNGIAALKGKDRVVAASLHAANQRLNKDQQFTFYVVKVERQTMESGEHCGGYHCTEDDDFEPCEVLEDGTTLELAFDFQGGKHKMKNVPFNVEEDLLDFPDKYGDDLDTFWGEHDGEEVEGPTGNEGSSRTRWYQNFIILAIPESKKFKLLCKSSFEESLDYLYREFKSNSSHFQEHMSTFLLEEFSAHSYSAKKEVLLKVTEMLQIIADTTLIQLFIANVLEKSVSNYGWRNERKAFGLYFDDTEKNFADLFQSVPWESIKLVVETLISSCQIDQFGRWLKVAEFSGITDISVKVIEIISLKLKEKTWIPKQEHHAFIVLLFRQLFKSEDLFTRWWSVISSCGEIIWNIDLLAALLSQLPTEHPIGYPFFLDSFICCLRRATDLGIVEKYSLLVFLVVKPLITNNNYRKQLEQLCNQLVSTSSLPIVGRLLGRLSEHQQSWSETETFQMFLDAFLNWLSVANLDESNLIEIINVAKILFREDINSEKQSQKFITSCQKIRNVVLLCTVTEELSELLKKNNVTNRTAIIKSLLNSLLELLAVQPVLKPTAMSPIILLMFKSADIFAELLNKFMVISCVSNSILLLGEVLSSLCSDSNKENYESLKANPNFQAALINYIRLFRQNKTVPDLSSYSALVSFAFANEDWCSKISANLFPGLISANCVKSDFRLYAGAIALMPLYNTDNYKQLLKYAVDALDFFMSGNQIIEVDYKLIVGFVQMLLKDSVCCGDALTQFASLNQLKANDEINMYSNSDSILKKLLIDLKNNHNNTKVYSSLLLMRVKNLQRVQAAGPPMICWSQPNAVIDGHPEVQRFLRSSKQTFVYRNFNGIGDARNWANKHFGSHRLNQNHKGYCCSAGTSGTGRNAQAYLTKIPNDKKKKKYGKLLAELQKSISELKAFPTIYGEAAKRPAQAMSSDIPVKKPVILID